MNNKLSSVNDKPLDKLSSVNDKPLDNRTQRRPRKIGISKKVKECLSRQPNAVNIKQITLETRFSKKQVQCAIKYLRDTNNEITTSTLNNVMYYKLERSQDLT